MTEIVKMNNVELRSAFQADLTPEERATRQAVAMEMVADERFKRKLPRFALALPYGGDPDEIALRLAGAVLVAEDPDEKGDGPLSSQDLVHPVVPVTVWDLCVMPSDQPNGLAFYLMLDVTVGGDPERKVVNTGAPQAITRLARAWFDGGLPIRGAFAEIEGTGKRGSAAITFIADLVQEAEKPAEDDEPF